MLPRVIQRQQTKRAAAGGAAGGRRQRTVAPLLSALIMSSVPVLWAVPCGKGALAAADNPAPFYANTFAKPPSAAAMTAVGRQLFLR